MDVVAATGGHGLPVHARALRQATLIVTDLGSPLAGDLVTVVAAGEVSEPAGGGIMQGVNVAEIREAFDQVFDHAIVFHGFADYMRDYDVFIHVSADPRIGVAPVDLRYRFKHCVSATVTTALTTEIWKRSLNTN